MKKVLLIICGGVLLMIGACSNNENESSPNKMLSKVLAEEDEVSYYGEMTLTTNVDEVEEMKMKEWRDGKKSRVEANDGKEESIAVNDGESMTVYEKNANKVMTFSLGELQELNHGPKEQLNMVLEAIKDTHEIEKVGNETIIGRDTVHIIATPNEEGSLLGEQEFWVDTEHWVVLKTESKAADFTSKIEYTKIDFNNDMDDDIFQLDVPDDAEVEEFDDDLGEEEISLEDVATILEDEVLYIPEEQGFAADRVTTYQVDEGESITDLEYKKDDVAHVTLTIISSSEDDIDEQFDIFGADAEKATIRDQDGIYIDIEGLQMVVWNEGAYQYNLAAADPALTLDDLTEIAEDMKPLK